MEFNSTLKFKKYLWSLAFVFILFGSFISLHEASAVVGATCTNATNVSGKCKTGTACTVTGETQLTPTTATACGSGEVCCQSTTAPLTCTDGTKSGQCQASCTPALTITPNAPGCTGTLKCCLPAATPPTGVACQSSTDATRKGTCQSSCSPATSVIPSPSPACSTAPNTICCATVAASKATCKDAGGTCKAKDPTTGSCAAAETLTSTTISCEASGGGGTAGQICCVAKAASNPDQAGAQGGNAPSGGDDVYSQIFNMMVAMLTFSISLVIHLAAWLAGQAVVLLMEVLIFISGYNSFIRNSYVSEGWKIMRDLVNMFFVLGMLFIAFATVLKIEKYSWNKLLGNLLIMAVLVNFSKTICGLIIDFFQVLLMTFAVAYKDISAGNIFSGLGMVDWFKVQTQAVAGNVSAGVQLGMIASAFLGLILALVSFIVILNFCVILITRIVGLWILITFSPLAFFSFVFKDVKGVGQIYETWQREFLQYCLIGPFVAFTLWISVATLPKIDVNQMVGANWYDTSKRAGMQVSFSEAGSMDRILKYLMSITTMIVGLGFAKKFSVVGASSLTGISDKFKDRTVGAASRFGRSVGDTAAAPFRGAAKGIQDTLMTNPTLRRWATSEGRKQQAQELEGKVQARFGPNVLAREQARQGITESDVKRMETQNKFNQGVENWNGSLNDAMKNGDLREARALMVGGADRGWTDDGHVKGFKDKFGKNFTAQEDLAFTDDLEKRVEKATGGHARFNEAMISGSGEMKAKVTPAEEFKNDAEKKAPNDFAKQYGNPNYLDSHRRDQYNPKTGKMESIEGNQYRDEKLLATIGLEQDAGSWDKRARTQIKKGLEELKQDPQRMSKLTPDQIAGLNKVYEACDAQYDGIKRREENGITSKGNENFFGQTSKGTATAGSGAATQAPSARVENIRTGTSPRQAKPKPDFKGDPEEQQLVANASQAGGPLARSAMDAKGKFKQPANTKADLKAQFNKVLNDDAKADALADRAMQHEEQAFAEEQAAQASDQINVQIGLQAASGATALPAKSQLEQNFSDGKGGYQLNKYDNAAVAGGLDDKQVLGMVLEAKSALVKYEQAARQNKDIAIDQAGIDSRKQALINATNKAQESIRDKKPLTAAEKAQILKDSVSESIAYMNSGEAIKVK